MKKLLFISVFVFTLNLITSCSSSNDIEDQSFDPNQKGNSVNVMKRNDVIIINHSEVMDFDNVFENESGINNLSLDNQRDVFIDVIENKLYIPINPGYNVNQPNFDSNVPKIKEVHGGIKFNLARKNASEDPSKCQGNCKCGIGFRCGSTGSVTIKTSHRVNFNPIEREAVAKQFIDIENDYYILEFVTIIDWNKLKNE